MRRLLRWIGWPIGLLAAVLIVGTLATARFGNAALYPPHAGSPRVEIVVVSHGYHAGIVVPRAAVADIAQRNGLQALAAAAARFAAYPHIEVGWGDEGFYTQVPTVASVTVAMALRALFMPGNPTVLHVVGIPVHPRAMFPGSEMAGLTLGDGGFARLAAALNASFAPGPDGGIQELGPGLYGPSLFFRAVGTFSLLRLCNHWVADLLDAAGVPTAPVLATMPQGLLWDLSWRAGAVRMPPSVR